MFKLVVGEPAGKADMVRHLRLPAATGPTSRLAIRHATPTGFTTIAAGTPFFIAVGDPDLAKAALVVYRTPPPTLAALGLDTYEACLEALQAERERRGLVRRRITKRLLPEG